MKPLFLITGLFCFALLKQNAQIITVNDWKQIGQRIEIEYNLASPDPDQLFFISVFVSMDGGTTYSENPLKLVSGEIGKNITAGTNKKIIWDVLKEMPDFGGNVVFDIRAKVYKVKENELFLGYKGCYTAPFGIVLGLTGKPGFYISARINMGIFENVKYETDGEIIEDYHETDYYTFIKGDKIQRLSITAGLQFKLGMKVNLYAGGGFARYGLLWQIEQYNYPDELKGTQWVKHTGESFNSYEVEAGIMVKLKHLFLAGGIASPDMKWADITFSAGYMF